MVVVIQKIISGGQTGAARAALDAAIRLGIPYGGWIPKGRLTEDGFLPEKYQLKEMPTSSLAKRTQQNILDSDGTLILTHGDPVDGSEIAIKEAHKRQHPCLHIDLGATSAFQAALAVADWIYENQIEVLNVTGSRASINPDIYQNTLHILESAYHLSLSGRRLGEYEKSAPGEIRQPQTVDEAISLILSELPLKDKVTMANMAEIELDSLHFTLGSFIRRKFGLWSGNESLIESCRFVSGKKNLDVKAVPEVIIWGLWKKLRESYKLRILK